MTEPKEVKTISEHTEDTLCSQLDGENAIRNACMIRLFSRCGIGLQEICALNIEDVGQNAITVRNKAGVRSVPLDEQTVSAINDYLEERLPPKDGSHAFFVSSQKGRMKRGAVQKMLRRVTSRSGSDTLEKITVRGLQISAKKKILDNGECNSSMINISSPYYIKKAYIQSCSPPAIRDGECQSRYVTDKK